jgi:hypothetical protein
VLNIFSYIHLHGSSKKPLESLQESNILLCFAHPFAFDYYILNVFNIILDHRHLEWNKKLATEVNHPSWLASKLGTNRKLSANQLTSIFHGALVGGWGRVLVQSGVWPVL